MKKPKKKRGGGLKGKANRYVYTQKNKYLYLNRGEGGTSVCNLLHDDNWTNDQTSSNDVIERTFSLFHFPEQLANIVVTMVHPPVLGDVIQVN